MKIRTACAAVAIWALAGCASAPPPEAPAAASLPWQDKVFAWEPALVRIDKEELFRLDADMVASLDLAHLQRMGTSQRLDALMLQIFGPDRARFGYLAGHSGTAAETWHRKRGDCLSLTVLTYAVARALGMDAQMQEVRVPAMYDRRDGLDYVSRHVNVRFQVMNRSPIEEVLQSRQIVIDFEPEFATAFKGKPLTDDAVLARYYNNLGAEFLTRGQKREAYAHFKAAILADPAHAPAYGNLAVLYREQRIDADAERLLRIAIVLGDEPVVPMRALHELLVDQGRHADAMAVADKLRVRQEADPYYWIAQGMRSLAEGDSRHAVFALERAQNMASGFSEIHRYLALAYWRLGERQLANRQLSLLASVDSGGVMTAKLRRKFGGATP